MPPKKSTKKREVKPKKPRQKQKQKQKQQQNVKINVTQGGSGGGGAPIILPPQTPIQFRDTSGENVKLTGLIKDLENRIAGFKQPIATAPIVNPANDPITTRSVFNAPITYNDDLAEEVLREITELERTNKNKPVKIPAGFNTPITYNDTLGEQVAREQEPPDVEFELVAETPKSKRGRKKGSKNKPKAPSMFPAPPEPTLQIPSTFLSNNTEDNMASSESEDIRLRRNLDTPVNFA
jgi:hypothetical protein